MSDHDHDPSGSSPPAPSTGALAAEVGATRAKVASDVRALKSQLQPEKLKERAIVAAERSAESVAAQAGRRLAGIPRALGRASREHPLAAAGIGLGLVVLLWKASTRRRAH
jgi:hypothetical protein